MLKKRIISLLTLNDGVLFRTKKFVPDYRYTLNFVDLDSVDEVVILDVTPEGEGDRANFYKTIKKFTSECFVPCTVGGKIRDLAEVDYLFREVGADKVVVESVLAENPRLAWQIAEKWGSQAICVGVTADRAGFYVDMDASEIIREAVGEVLFQTVERDGSLLGYDIARLLLVRQYFSEVPVIAGSGCGTWEHMRHAFEAGADAAATSCIHHFPPNAIKAAKAYLEEHGVAVRPAA
jgi:cyclase